MLRTSLFTLTAFLTVLSLLSVSSHAFPLPADHAVVLIHVIAVPAAEISRDIHAKRTGHAITASRTAILDAAVHDLLHLFNGLIFLFLHGDEIRKGLEIILDLLHVGHTAEHRQNVRQRCHIAKCKGCCGRSGADLMKYIHDVLAKSSQGTTLDRLHNGKGNPLLLRQLITLDPGLILGVHVIELDLTEIPITIVNDLFKNIIGIMEREPKEPDLPLRLQFLQTLYAADLHHFSPASPVQRMH